MASELPKHKTFKGKIQDCYYLMVRRVKGEGTRSPHLYINLEIVSQEEFIEWAMEDGDYNLLYTEWLLSDFDRKLAPSVNRIDSSKGYVIGNIEWITLSENSRLGSLNRHYGGTIR